jgi:hypothetical protein
VKRAHNRGTLKASRGHLVHAPLVKLKISPGGIPKSKNLLLPGMALSISSMNRHSRSMTGTIATRRKIKRGFYSTGSSRFKIGVYNWKLMSLVGKCNPYM